MYEPFPADNWRYCQFAQYLAWEDMVPETVDNYMGTVRVLQRLQNLPVPPQGQIHFKLASEGLKKKCKKPVKQAVPIKSSGSSAAIGSLSYFKVRFSGF